MPNPVIILSRRSTTGARQSGFTLVELITVVVILGVLAAVALPRFSGLQGNARAAKADALAGSIRAAAAMVKAQAVAQAISCGAATPSSTVSMEGAAINLNYCYPQALGDAAAGGIITAANIDPTRDGVTIPASGTGSGGAGVGAQLVIQINGAKTPANCQITYTSPTAADGQPSVVVDKSDC